MPGISSSSSARGVTNAFFGRIRLTCPSAAMALGATGSFAVEIDRIGDAPDMPELQQDQPARLVHRLRHQLPALDLLVRPDARRIGIDRRPSREIEVASEMISPAPARCR